MSSHRITKNYRETTMNSLQTISTCKRKWKLSTRGQEEMKNTISELKNTVEGMKSRLDEAVDRMSELEVKVEKNSQNEQEKEKRVERMKRV